MHLSRLLLPLVLLALFACSRYADEFESEDKDEREDRTASLSGSFTSEGFSLDGQDMQDLIVFDAGRVALLRVCTGHCTAGQATVDVDFYGRYRVLDDELRLQTVQSCRKLRAGNDRSKKMQRHYFFRVSGTEETLRLREISETKLLGSTELTVARAEAAGFPLGPDLSATEVGCFDPETLIKAEDLKAAQAWLAEVKSLVEKTHPQSAE
jgi:hypothetical protein